MTTPLWPRAVEAHRWDCGCNWPECPGHRSLLVSFDGPPGVTVPALALSRELAHALLAALGRALQEAADA